MIAEGLTSAQLTMIHIIKSVAERANGVSLSQLKERQCFQKTEVGLYGFGNLSQM